MADAEHRIWELEQEVERLKAEVARLQALNDDLLTRGIAPVKIGSAQYGKCTQKGDTCTVDYKSISGTKHEFKYIHVDEKPKLIQTVDIYIYGADRFAGVFVKSELPEFFKATLSDQAQVADDIEVNRG